MISARLGDSLRFLITRKIVFIYLFNFFFTPIKFLVNMNFLFSFNRHPKDNTARGLVIVEFSDQKDLHVQKSQAESSIGFGGLKKDLDILI